MPAHLTDLDISLLRGGTNPTKDIPCLLEGSLLTHTKVMNSFYDTC